MREAKILNLSTQRSARNTESIAKATELIGDDATFNFDAYDELDSNTKIGVMNVINDRCTKYKGLQSSDDGVSAAKISDKCLRCMLTVEFDISAFQESKLERKLKRKRKSNSRYRKRKIYHDTKKESNKPVELSDEERRAILKEVKDHTELLREFAGVIPDDELAARKRALYAALPTNED
jgi:hypothetical protein